MERIDVALKTGVALIGSFVSWMIGGLGLAFVVLLGLMAIDFITGMMAGTVGEGLKSKFARA